MIDYKPDTEWPPAHLAPVRAEMAKWEAWYRGDAGALEAAYSGVYPGGAGSAYSRPGRPHVYTLPSQYRGGVVGRVARFWWGQPSGSNQTPAKLHIPLATDIATGSADLLFGQELGIDYATAGVAERMGQILDENNLHALLLQAAEMGAWSGGSYLRVVTDPAVSQNPIIDVNESEQAIPAFRWGRLQSVQFWQVVKRDGGTVWRHIEDYQPGYVEHALFEGTIDKIGRKVDFGAVPELLELGVDANSRIATEGLAAFYVPNVLPNRLWKNTPNIGRSDFAGSEGLFDAVDEAWSSLMRDVRLGKARITVPQNALQQFDGPGAGSMLDLDQEVFVGLNLPANGENDINQTQFDIRSQQHLEVIEAAMIRAIEGCGYAAASFGLGDVGGQQTATEITARRERSITTRGKKILYWKNTIENLLDCVARTAGLGEAGSMVEFPKSVAPTQLELANVAQTMYNAKAASTRERVRIVHPDWDDEQVDAEADLIDNADALADPAEVGREAAAKAAEQAPVQVG